MKVVESTELDFNAAKIQALEGELETFKKKILKEKLKHLNIDFNSEFNPSDCNI